MKKINWNLFFIFGGILLLAIFCFGFGLDYYWHVKAGEYMVQNLKIPYHDIFSWYGISHNLYWMSHEWLSEVVLYGFKFLFKDLGPFLFSVTMYLVLLFILFKGNKEKFEKNKIFTFIWALVGAVIFSRVMMPRPHMISYVLLACTIYVLYDNFDNKSSKKIYFLPIISMLWANFHGGSSNLPYVLCGLFLLAGLFQFKFGKIEAKKISKQQLKKYIICGLLSVVAITANPHGLKMISYPYINMGDSLMISSIQEWASPSLNNTSDYGDFLLLGGVILVMIVTNKKIRLVDLLLLGAFLVLGFKSLKFTSLLYIVATFSIFNMVEEFDFCIPKLLTTVIIITLIVSGGILTPRLIANYQKKVIPDEIISYIKKKSPERLYNHYGYGGYLIYHNIPVFIDGRADMYSKYNFKDAIDIQNMGYSYLLNSYNFDMLVIPSDTSLNTHLSEKGNYRLVKQVEDVAIYEKVE